MMTEKRLQRGAGILLPVGSLPSKYGIGSLGSQAFRFIDKLVEAGQTYWQVLPVGPTGYGDSPYQSFSAFAGNPYFVDLELLHAQGLLTDDELHAAEVSDNAIPYEHLYHTRLPLLRRAAERFSAACEEFQAFCRAESFWLEDYARYMTIKAKQGEREWTRWEIPLRDRYVDALATLDTVCDEELHFWRFCQYHFFCQWQAVKQYANERGILLIGDIPIYVSQDSSDVWSHRELFELDDAGMPTSVAGVPPDYFSQDGQRWGNPLYRYDRMAEDDFAWWRSRMTMCARLYDVVRIDHFIGMARYYAIPADCSTAKDGAWREGPKTALTDALDRVCGNTRILAEDLGVLHPSVRDLLKTTGYPGMKVLLFAFDSDSHNEYLPHHYSQNCVVYAGTHDNQTVVGFCQELPDWKRQFLLAYLGIQNTEDIPMALLRTAYASVADVAIFQMQDILGLDNHARMNTPSTLGGNWQWRLMSEQLDQMPTEMLRKLTALYSR